MFVVVNRLPIKPNTDWDAIAAEVDAFNSEIAHPHFRGITLVRTDENDAIMLVMFTSRATLDEISRTQAGPWFAANIGPHLAGPASRSVGEVVAGEFHSP